MNTPATILIVDDELAGRRTMEALLLNQGYTLTFAENGYEAIQKTLATKPDLVLLDLVMPEMNGFEVCRSLRERTEVAEIPIVIITSLDERQARLQGLEAGADDFISKPFDGTELRARVRTITRLNRYRKLRMEHERLEGALRDLELAYEATLAGWVYAIDLRDHETDGHTQRVTEMTLQLAYTVGMSKEELVHVRRGALLHDIGKLGIPDAILSKPTALSPAEWEIMRKHPIYAQEWLQKIEYLRPAMDIPVAHHEKWDGTGYPYGLEREKIPLAARCFALADVWDSLGSPRPHKPAWDQAKVLDYIRAQSGRHFDPNLVDLFLMLARHGAVMPWVPAQTSTNTKTGATI